MIQHTKFTFKVEIAHKDNDPVFMKLANAFETWCIEQGHIFAVVFDKPTTEAWPAEDLI
jgi:hypothetical protein